MFPTAHPLDVHSRPTGVTLMPFCNDDISAERMRDLFLAHDGPIPAHLLETPATERRRDLGTLAVFERQFMEFLDAAMREDDKLREAETVDAQVYHQTHLRRYVNHAAEALRDASKMRFKLGLPEHPVVLVMKEMNNG